MNDLIIKTQISDLIDEIGKLPHDFHLAGTVPISVLHALVKYCGLNIPFSMETGSGLSTILFSHISNNHKVFAVDAGNSISSVKRSELFNAQNVEFIEGPTQKTLPCYEFTNKLNVVLLDGPHGYPFPDLEYYHIYPYIEAEGILIIDDIQIPTIHNLFNFLKDDDMFELLEVVDGNTAFFKRTNIPSFPQYGDSWEFQKYNKK